MKPVFQVDGVGYDVFVPAGGIKRSAAILDGDKAGRVQTGRMERDIIGTYYNYTIQIDAESTDAAAYDALYAVLTAPVVSHQISVPYGQDVLQFEAYVSGADDALQMELDDLKLWGGLAVTFTAMEPKRIPA